MLRSWAAVASSGVPVVVAEAVAETAAETAAPAATPVAVTTTAVSPRPSLGLDGTAAAGVDSGRKDGGSSEASAPDAVAAALNAAKSLGFWVTGHAAVTSLNPDGPPFRQSSVAFIVGLPSALKFDEAARAFVEHVRSHGFPTCRSSQQGDLLRVSVDGQQVATLSGFPPRYAGRAEEVSWDVPIRHACGVWTFRQFVPAVLRSELVERNGLSTVALLDSFVAERCVRGLHIGKHPAPPLPPASSSSSSSSSLSSSLPSPLPSFLPLPPPLPVAQPSPWPFLDAWCNAIIGSETLPVLRLPPLFGAAVDMDALRGLHAAARTAFMESPGSSTPLHAFLHAGQARPAGLAALMALTYAGGPAELQHHAKP